MARIYVAYATSITPPASGPLTATPAPDATPPYVQLEVNLTTAMRTALGTSPLTVQRLDPDGVWRPVRGAEPAPVTSGGFWTGQDFEAPFLVPVRYRGVRADNGSVIVTGVTGLPDGSSAPELTLQVTQTWLQHPGVPSRSQPLRVWRWPAKSQSARQTVFHPIGRTRGVALSLPRTGVESQVQVRTDTLDQARRMVSLLSDGQALLLNVPEGNGWGESSVWVSVGKWTTERVVEYGADPARLWTLPYEEVDRPVGGQQSTWSYAALAAERLTYQSVRTAYATYADLAAHRPR